MNDDRKQVNVRLPADLIERMRRVKDGHTLRPTWDRLLESVLSGEKDLATYESEVKRKRGKR